MPSCWTRTATTSSRPAELYNLRADRWISGHSDVTGPQVANALLGAAAHR